MLDPEITQQLAEAASGDREALERVLPLVYERARDLAGGLLASDRARHWVGSSSLVHMAVVRLLQTGKVRDVSDQTRAMVLLAAVMRNVVVDVARRETAQKRGGDRLRLSLSLDALETSSEGLDVILLDDAMRALAEVDRQCAAVIELRIWGGLKPETVAEVLELSPGRVRALWNRGKAFLAADLRERGSVGAEEGV